jgi:transcriptional regulator with XRE-family HTH domain
MKIIQTTKDLGPMVRTIRKTQGMTQEDLAAVCGVGGTLYPGIGAGERILPHGKSAPRGSYARGEFVSQGTFLIPRQFP